MRKTILARHVVTIIFFLLANLYTEVTSIVYAIEGQQSLQESYNGPFAIALKFLYSMQGFFLPFTRLFEPYFYAIVVKKVLEI